jgi:hypothetical protein
MPVATGSALERLREAEEFFLKKAPVQSTLERLARRLDQEGIAYAVIGGMALNVHGYVRVTRAVDVLLGPDGLEAFVRLCVGRGYVAAFPGAGKAFLDAESRIPIEILTAGEYPGDGKPKAVAFPDPATSSVEIDGIRVVALPRLVELKLRPAFLRPPPATSADVQDLIGVLGLPPRLAMPPDQRGRVSALSGLSGAGPQPR